MPDTAIRPDSGRRCSMLRRASVCVTDEAGDDGSTDASEVRYQLSLNGRSGALPSSVRSSGSSPASASPWSSGVRPRSFGVALKKSSIPRASVSPPRPPLAVA